jgi:hypothetical protein
MDYQYNDGGRAAAGFKGDTRDCVTRAVAIATRLPYAEVYDTLNALTRDSRAWARLLGNRMPGARTGIPKPVTKKMLTALGWTWHPTMQIGSGCRVHLRADELPPGRLIVRLSRHMAAVIDGTLHDTFDCSRNGTRCVYGYWSESK